MQRNGQTRFLTVTTNHDWGVPRFIINDKNFKFMFFLETVFRKAKDKKFPNGRLTFLNRRAN